MDYVHRADYPLLNILDLLTKIVRRDGTKLYKYLNLVKKISLYSEPEDNYRIELTPLHAVEFLAIDASADFPFSQCTQLCEHIIARNSTGESAPSTSELFECIEDFTNEGSHHAEATVAVHKRQSVLLTLVRSLPVNLLLRYSILRFPKGMA